LGVDFDENDEMYDPRRHSSIKKFSDGGLAGELD